MSEADVQLVRCLLVAASGVLVDCHAPVLHLAAIVVIFVISRGSTGRGGLGDGTLAHGTVLLDLQPGVHTLLVELMSAIMAQGKLLNGSTRIPVTTLQY